MPGAPAITDLDEFVLGALLDAMPVARLALRDDDERPYALPIVFARVGQSLWSPVDAKPKRHARLARLARLGRFPEVTLLLDHYAADWQDLWWLRLYGTAAVVAGDHPSWDAARAALAGKYPQYRGVAMFRGEPVMIRFAWVRHVWWAAQGRSGVERWLAVRRGAGGGSPDGP